MLKKNQRTRAFMATIATLLLSAIVIATASYAWFTLGRNAMASDLDLKITKQGEGIQISANTNTFTDTLTFEDLNGTSTTGFQAPTEDYNFFPANVSPSSSQFGLNNLPVFFTGGIDRATKTLESFASTSTNGVDIYGKSGVETPSGGKFAGFYAFDVFINYTATEGNTAQVKINQSTIAVKNDDSDGTQAIAETTNAMRIGFVNCGVVTPSENPAQATSGTESIVFATNEAARNTAPITSTGISDQLDDDAYTVPSAQAGSISLASGYSGSFDSTEQPNDSTLTLQSGVNRIRIYVWMEGQDAACTDELQSQLVSANLVFSLV